MFGQQLPIFLTQLQTNTNMTAPAKELARASIQGVFRTSRHQALSSRAAAVAASTSLAPRHPSTTSVRTFTNGNFSSAPNGGLFSLAGAAGASAPQSYFQRPSLPANTIVRFVPQQTAWIVERMGKFHRILQPGLAILMPVIDRIAYVKSLKEAALEIPSQSAITADNVTLDLDGVLYTRVFDAYKARYGKHLYAACP